MVLRFYRGISDQKINLSFIIYHNVPISIEFKIKFSGNKRSSCYSNRSNNSSHSESIDRSSGREIVESKDAISSQYFCHNQNEINFSLGTNSEKRLSITSGNVQSIIFVRVKSGSFVGLLNDAV